jgi:Protein of unknown function (DUF664)
MGELSTHLEPPMTSAELLVDAFGRIREVVHRVVDGLTSDHLADAAGAEQVWTSQGWVERFGLPFDPRDTGYGHRSEEVADVQVGSGELLAGYHDAVHQQTIRYVERLEDADLDRIVDRSWDPPVSLGVRLVSVIADDLQHAGQAAFVRGVLQRG